MIIIIIIIIIITRRRIMTINNINQKMLEIRMIKIEQVQTR